MSKICFLVVLFAISSLSGAILTTAQADIRTFSTQSSSTPILNKIEHAMVSLSFNTDMNTVSGSIDFGTLGRINIESASLPKDDTEDPFTIDGFFQELGGMGNTPPLHPNAKIVLLFIDPTTVVGSFTAGKKEEFTGSFVLKLK